MARVNYKKVFYPESGAGKVTAVRDVAVEFRAAMEDYLDAAQTKLSAEAVKAIKLDNIVKAKAMILDAQRSANKDSLVVRGGLDVSGDLVITITGRSPAATDPSVVVHKGFENTIRQILLKGQAAAPVAPKVVKVATPPGNAVAFREVFYPQSGQVKVAAVKDVAAEFRRAMEMYLRSEFNLKAEDVQDIVLENVSEAQALVNRAKAAANQADLVVRGGLAPNGDLVLAVIGPGSSAAGAPVVLRANFEKKVIQRLRNQKNAVVNIEPDKADAQGNLVPDATIAEGVQHQARRLGTQVQKTTDDADVGGIKVGTIVLAAHGDHLDSGQGLVMGTKLGQKTPEQIVALLTENPDANKRLSPKFRGTIVLSGCFTGAGVDGIAPEGYDYSIFAGQVYQLLLKKNYKGFRVQGNPGPSKVDEQGRESVLPVEDFQKREKVQAKLKRATNVLLANRETGEKLEATSQTVLGRQKEALAEIARLQTEIGHLDPDIEKNQTEREELDQEIADLETDLKAAQTDAGANPRARGQVMRLSSELQGKQQQQAGLKSEAAALQQKQTDLGAQWKLQQENSAGLHAQLEQLMQAIEDNGATHAKWYAKWEKQANKNDELMNKFVRDLVVTFGKREI